MNLQSLLQTGGIAATLLRITLGLVILPHGWQKISNFGNTMYHLQQDYQVPWLLAVMVILTEFFGSVFLILGLGSRLMALALVLVMAGAVFMGHHWQHGFFMNWFGNQKGEGFEYHLLAIGMGIAIMILGSGKWSADLLLVKK